MDLARRAPGVTDRWPPTPDVVVVRADDDGLIAAGRVAARQHADDVANRAAVLRQVLGVADPGARQRSGSRHQVVVDPAGARVERERVDQRLGLLAADAEHRDVGRLGVGILREQAVVGLVARVRRVADDDQQPRAAVARRGGLGFERRLRQRPRAVQAAVRARAPAARG